LVGVAVKKKVLRQIQIANLFNAPPDVLYQGKIVEQK
jgi:hypothetical protein